MSVMVIGVVFKLKKTYLSHGIGATFFPYTERVRATYTITTSLIGNPLQNSLMDLEAAVQFRRRIDGKCRQ